MNKEPMFVDLKEVTNLEEKMEIHKVLETNRVIIRKLYKEYLGGCSRENILEKVNKLELDVDEFIQMFGMFFR